MEGRYHACEDAHPFLAMRRDREMRFRSNNPGERTPEELVGYWRWVNNLGEWDYGLVYPEEMYKLMPTGAFIYHITRENGHYEVTLVGSEELLTQMPRMIRKDECALKKGTKMNTLITRITQGTYGGKFMQTTTRSNCEPFYVDGGYLYTFGNNVIKRSQTYPGRKPDETILVKILRPGTLKKQQ